VEGIEARGQVVVLKGNRLDDNNTMEQPRKVVPAASEIGGVGRSFKHEFPAHSLTVMRLKSK
jgi:alpha-N-arabinofuranosidase